MTFREQLTITIIDKLIIAILIATVGFFFNRMLESFKTQQTTLIESFKSQETRKNEIARERRIAIAELAKKIAAAYHSMEWLTWKAVHDSTGFCSKDIDAYDNEIKSLFTQIVGTRVVAAAVAPGLNTQAGKMAQELYILDAEISFAGSQYKVAQQENKDTDVSRMAIAEVYPRIVKQRSLFVQKVSEIAGIDQDGPGNAQGSR